MVFNKNLDLFRAIGSIKNQLAASIPSDSNNTITVPNHFFTTGQKVNYSAGAGTSIGVSTAPFSMPSSVFIIKKGEDKVQVALTAENALKQIALPIGLSTVGIGTSHTFTAIDANQKVLLSLIHI